MTTVTVTDLVLNFADACRALVPNLERARVSWRDSEQYDNWGRVAEPLFQSLVTEPCAFHAVGEAGLGKLRIARYGFPPAPDCNAWIGLDGTQVGQMLDLSSVSKPFDSVRCSDGYDLIALTSARFLFIYEEVGGTQRRLDAVDLLTE